MESSRAIASAIEGVASLPAEERTRVMKSLLEGVDFSSAGKILTGLAKAANGLHEENPRFLADTLRPGIASFIEGTDFGELKEMVDGSVEDMTALVAMINEELWKYPAKFICLISAVPALVNMGCRRDQGNRRADEPDGAGPAYRRGPFADEQHRRKNIGRLVNEFCELVRKIHTGSALLGEPGKPQFPKSVARLTGETMSTVDINLLLKARGLLAEIKEMTLLTFIDMLENSPELARDFFQSHFRSLVAFFRRWSHKADAFEALFNDDDVAEEFAKGMGEIDAQEVAVTISRMCGLFNRVREKTPGIIKNTVAQTISSLDHYEMAETARWFTADMVEGLKPLAPEILPPIIRGVADLLAQDDGTGEMGEALGYLRNVLLGKEAGGMKSVFMEAATSLNNDFVKKWKESGKRVVGYTCSYVPDEIFYSVGILPYRIRGFGAEDTTIGDTYFGPFICSLPKCMLQLAGEGRFDFLDGAIITPGCDSMRRLDECWRKAGGDIPGSLPKFFFHFGVPHKYADYTIKWFAEETRRLIDAVETALRREG